MVALFRRTRAMVKGDTRLSAEQLGDVRVDLLRHDYAVIAARVVEDLDSGCVFTRSEGMGFEARWILHGEAQRFAQEF